MGTGKWSRKTRGAVFFMVAGDRNPVENFGRFSMDYGLSTVVGSLRGSGVPEDDDGLEDSENYLWRMEDKLEEKAARHFYYGLLEVERPFYVPVVRYGDAYDESFSVYSVYLMLKGRNDIARDARKIDEWLTENKVRMYESSYRKAEKYIVSSLKERGYDGVVWADGDKPMEIMYFGRNRVKWLGEQ